jgi:hypothetical protein
MDYYGSSDDLGLNVKPATGGLHAKAQPAGRRR